MFNKSVDSITKNLKTMVSKLETLAQTKVQEAGDHITNSELYKSLASEAHEEAAKAKHVADKVKELLGIE